ncbi:MarR family transcriptional regulator, partial [Bacillus spizizenii]|nr:MarR family transcriptional regulator [Bacillus spizizenii]
SIDTRDRRLVFVSITDSGKQAIEELYPEFHKGETALIAGLTKDEQKTLTELLRKVADNLHTT